MLRNAIATITAIWHAPARLAQLESLVEALGACDDSLRDDLSDLRSDVEGLEIPDAGEFERMVEDGCRDVQRELENDIEQVRDDLREHVDDGDIHVDEDLDLPTVLDALERRMLALEGVAR